MKRYISHIKLVFFTLFLAGLYSFSNLRNSHRTAEKPDIHFLNGENLFITHEAVNKLLIQNINGASNVAKEALVLNTVENALNANKMIRDAQVFMTVDGRLKARIKQRTPIARVDSATDFYIDSEGKSMPLSGIYTARVPIVTGDVKTDIAEPTYALVDYINKDEFLKKNVIGIHCEKGRFELKLRVDDFVVELGKPTRINTKFNNFKAFYQKALKDNTLKQYSSVNLEYNKQVICTKK